MNETIRNIRKDCRLAMNGVLSASMREYGLDYKLNFGLVIQQIKAIAAKYEHSAELASALWTDTTRELKILATLVYPIDEFTPTTANQWVEQIPNQEIREQVCINLFQQLPYATELAKEWCADSREEIRISGYWLLARLLLTKKMKGEISCSDFDHFIWNDILSTNLFLRNASSLVLKHLVRKSKKEGEDILNKLQTYKEDRDPLKREAYNGIAFEFEFMYL